MRDESASDSPQGEASQQQRTLIRSAITFLLHQLSKLQTYLTYWEPYVHLDGTLTTAARM